MGLNIESEELEIKSIVKAVENKAKGKEVGRAEGEAKAKTEFAQNLIADGFDHAKIAQLQAYRCQISKPSVSTRHSSRM